MGWPRVCRHLYGPYRPLSVMNIGHTREDAYLPRGSGGDRSVTAMAEKPSILNVTGSAAAPAASGE